MLSLSEWISMHYWQLQDRKANRIDGEVQEGTVRMYWVSTIIRIDIKPNEK